jgi:hypothetical protein
MLPEPTPPKRAARPARPQPWGMTPLFSVPGSGEPEDIPSPRRRPRAPRNGVTGKPAPHKDAAELLAVTAERLRRSLARSFLRYGIPGDLEAAVHAAMNVVEPVIEARDGEILRLRGLMAGKIPGKISGR